MKILAYIYLFDILLKITSPQAHCEGMKDNRIAIAIKLTAWADVAIRSAISMFVSMTAYTIAFFS